MITVEEFIDMAVDSFYIEVYDEFLDQVMYNGNSADIPDEIMGMEVRSFDPPCVIGERVVLCLNVSSEEE